MVMSGVHQSYQGGATAVMNLFALQHFIARAILQRWPLLVAFVDLQKAYDTVQHDLSVGPSGGNWVSPCMLAAISRHAPAARSQ